MGKLQNTSVAPNLAESELGPGVTPNLQGQQKHPPNIFRKLRFVRRLTVNKTWRATIFTIALALIGISSLIYSSKALANIVFYPLSDDVLKTKVILKPDTTSSPDAAILEGDLLDARQVVARRLDQLNLSGPYYLVNQSGQLAVTLPESEKMPYIINIITHVGEIEFIDGGIESPPLGQQIKTGFQANPGQNIYPVLFTGQEVEEVVPPDSATGQIFYRLNLNPAAAHRFADFVETQPDHYVCMVIDKQVINCSIMYHWNHKRLDILPNLSSGAVISLADLAVFLDSGPLPVPLQVER
jgi:preprotein translocase subunit SecD